jgi:prolyl-tRNA synthetase
MDVDGKAKPIIMGSYGIGVGRALACLAEQYYDQFGLKLPISVAPYHVNLILINDSDEIGEAAEKMYADLSAAGVEVLYDDRDKKIAGPGVKFKDADLRGVPIRVTISRRSVENGGVELKVRNQEEVRIVSIESVVAEVQGIVAALFAEIDAQVAAQPTWESEKELWY